MTLPRYLLLDKENVAHHHDDLEQLIYQLGDETLSVWEIESCKLFDVTKDACDKWCDKLGDRAELDAFGELNVPTIIKNNCGDWVAEQEEHALEHIASLRYERRQYQSAAL